MTMVGMVQRCHQPRRQHLDPLHRIASAPPRRIGYRCQDVRPRAGPLRRHFAVERVEAQSEIAGDRPVQRRVDRVPAGARHACDGDEGVDPLAPRRRCAQRVQSVANLHLLQFAEMGVERPQRLTAAGAIEAEVAVEAVPLRERDDFLLQMIAAPFVDAGSEIKFIDQSLQLGERAVGLRPRHRRHEVIDDDRGCAPFGLAALARIVDDEGIDQRRFAEHCLRPAGFRQAECLARQPFEVAMLADVNDRVGAERSSQPRVEGEIVMRRHEIGVVVSRLRVDGITALRLDADDDVAEAVDGKMERALAEERIVLGCAPAVGQRGADGFREGVEEGGVVIQVQGLAHSVIPAKVGIHLRRCLLAWFSNGPRPSPG
jgi:hypothetical protein